jgi:hypothetical protein
MLGLVSTHNDVDFGKVMLGATNPVPAQTVTLTNAGGGTDALRLGALDLSGAEETQFSLTNDTCTNAVLVADATCTVDVSYAPAAQVGSARAQLNVPSANGKDAQGGQRILLRGRVSDGSGKDARVTGPISPDNGYPEWNQGRAVRRPGRPALRAARRGGGHLRPGAADVVPGQLPG